ncbi:MAG: glycoside hydrolase family 16 protein [Pseudomonadota bacterium]
MRMKKITGLAAVISTVIVASAANAEEVASELSDWTLVWSDEFDGDALDLDKWEYEVDCWGGGNEERQCYTARPENVSVADGVLSLTARQEWMRGSALPEHLRKTPEDEAKLAVQPFSSGRIVTKGKADWLYGRFEVRAKLPRGQGLWPAIWMLPTDESYGAWAASGEIDIVEAVNLGAQCNKCPNNEENRIYGTLHFGGEWPENTYKGKETGLPEPADDFHIFAVEWREGEIVWFVDGKEYHRLTSRDWRSSTSAGRKREHAPFDHPFYMIFNVAVGGHLADGKNEGGISLDGFPKSMLVDWVRVYQHSADAASAN